MGLPVSGNVTPVVGGLVSPSRGQFQVSLVRQRGGRGMTCWNGPLAVDEHSENSVEEGQMDE